MTLSIACFDSDLVLPWTRDLEAAGIEVVILERPSVRPGPDPRAWSRAVSELALVRWLLLPTHHAAGALLDEAGGLGPTLRIAAIEEAVPVLAQADRAADEVAASLGDLLARVAPLLGRRQRVLAPHVAGGGRWLTARLGDAGAEALCVEAYSYVSSGPAPRLGGRLLGLVSDATEAESMLSATKGDPGLALVTLCSAATDAARDCGAPEIHAFDLLPPSLAALLDGIRSAGD